jgi:hypothetical protein
VCVSRRIHQSRAITMTAKAMMQIRTVMIAFEDAGGSDQSQV